MSWMKASIEVPKEYAVSFEDLLWDEYRKHHVKEIRVNATHAKKDGYIRIEYLTFSRHIDVMLVGALRLLEYL